MCCIKNNIVVHIRNNVNYDALKCWKFLKPTCLYGVKTETSSRMVYGEIKACYTCPKC